MHQDAKKSRRGNRQQQKEQNGSIVYDFMCLMYDSGASMLVKHVSNRSSLYLTGLNVVGDDAPNCQPRMPLRAAGSLQGHENQSTRVDEVHNLKLSSHPLTPHGGRPTYLSRGPAQTCEGRTRARQKSCGRRGGCHSVN